MKIKKGKIVECTEAELFEYWLKRYAEIMSFTDYMRHCEAHGTLVTDKVELFPDRKFYSYNGGSRNDRCY